MATGRPAASTATISNTPFNTSSGGMPGWSASPVTHTVMELRPTRLTQPRSVSWLPTGTGARKSTPVTPAITTSRCARPRAARKAACAISCRPCPANKVPWWLARAGSTSSRVSTVPGGVVMLRNLRRIEPQEQG